MEIVRGVVIILHLVGFAMLFGVWAVAAWNRRVRVTGLMQWGLVVALVSGLALAAPWGLDDELNYMKISTKLVVLLIIGALLGISGARQRRDKPISGVLFWLIGLLTLLNTAIAVLA